MKKITSLGLAVAGAAAFANPVPESAGLPVLDLSADAWRQSFVAQGTKETYEGHPTTLLSDDKRTMFCIWTPGHGGAVSRLARSDDGGRSWTRVDELLPADYVASNLNCPTFQKIKGPDGKTRYFAFSCKLKPETDESGRKLTKPERLAGLGMLVSEDGGGTWRELPRQPHLSAGMPPTGLMRLKDGTTALFGQVRCNRAVKTDGPNDDQEIWMSVSRDGGFTWGEARIVASKPGRNLCEPCCIRSPDGRSLALLMRDNRHTGPSAISFSHDEGKTWSEPRDTQDGLTGDRHEAIMLPDGRYFIAFRNRHIGDQLYGQFMAWVGTWDDLANGGKGQCRVHLLKHHGKPGRWPGNEIDTGYPGVELLPDGTIVCTTYTIAADDGRQSSVVSTRLNVKELPAVSQAGEVRHLSAAGDDAADGRTPQSAWRTVEKLNADLPAGGTALLRRGDVFYGGLRLPSGTDASHPTVLADYGTGPKPVLSAVKIIRSDPSVWKGPVMSRWRVNLADPTNCTGVVTRDCNPGFLLVDGEVKAWKRHCRDDLVSPWDFCGEDGWLHVHAPKNPALLAKDIRVALNVHGVVFQSHTVISNIAVRATGAHGMYGGWSTNSICEDVRISDCDFENVGGSELPHYSTKTRVRYGNGVEFGSNCRNAVVERCTFKGTYDVAVTMQGHPTLTSWSDIHVRNCTMTDCTQAFEVWCGKAPKGMGFERCSFTGNRTLRVGGGWGPVVRPVRACATPLLVYGMDTDVVDVTVSGNTFEDAPWGLLHKSGGLGKMPAGYRIRDNVFRRVQGKPAVDGVCPHVPYKIKTGGDAAAAAADLLPSSCNLATP